MKKFLVILVPIIIFLFYSNCARELTPSDAYTQASNPPSSTPTPNPGPSPSPSPGPAPSPNPTPAPAPAPAPTPSPSSATCQNTTPTLATINVSFPGDTDVNTQCPWGVGDNLPLQNVVTTARIEQSFSMSTVPANAKICTVDFQPTSNPNYSFDDLMFLVLDNVIIAMTNDAHLPRFTQTAQGYVWDWLAIRGLSSLEGNGTNYCVGGASTTCTLPQASTQVNVPVVGAMNLDFSDTHLAAIMQNSGMATHSFKYISTGDNDPNDCTMSPLSFTILVYYVP